MCSSANPTHRDAVDQPAEISELIAAVPPPSSPNVTREEKKASKGKLWKREMIEHGDTRRIISILGSLD